MTISESKPNRTAAATAARMRRSEAKWAEHLRERGWAVIDPEHMGALETLVLSWANPGGGLAPISAADVWERLGMPDGPRFQ